MSWKWQFVKAPNVWSAKCLGANCPRPPTFQGANYPYSQMSRSQMSWVPIVQSANCPGCKIRISRDPHMSKFLSSDFDLCVNGRRALSASPPTQTPILMYYLCLCRLLCGSLPILPYMPFCVVSPLARGKISFR